MERGRLDVDPWIARRTQDEEFQISAITASELLYGVHRAADPGIRARRAAYVEAVIDRFPSSRSIYPSRGSMRACGPI